MIARPLRRTVGAVISGRLKAAAAMPVPGSAAGTAAVPHQAPGPDRTTSRGGRRREDRPTPTPPSWADLEHQQEQLRRGIDRHPVCEADAGRCPTLAVIGETQCAEHLGWPLCPGRDGHPCTARTRTGDQCVTCQDEARYARLDSGGVGDLEHSVRSKNPKGRVMAQLVENNVRYERGGQGVFSTRDEVEFGGELDSMPLWFLLYERNDAGELSAELSLPVKMEGKCVNKWSERIPLFIHTEPGLDIALLDAPDNGDDPDFDIKKAH
ncbi:hypothetical protein [Streptomyces sp. SH5]|uniref:hypothetical protein n=1 Tax=Streptomyces sp. SH5 TaxID=3041765 RepID=UPI002477FC28|nr:hypothetical protein [Streptomyces sp. SH5]WGP08174.1 hypothetical protein QFA72_00025 [Streptomyces sp. SH5]